MKWGILEKLLSPAYGTYICVGVGNGYALTQVSDRRHGRVYAGNVENGCDVFNTLIGRADEIAGGVIQGKLGRW